MSLLKEHLEGVLLELDLDIKWGEALIEQGRNNIASGEEQRDAALSKQGEVLVALATLYPTNVVDVLTLDDLADGAAWEDECGAVLTRHGDEVRRTYKAGYHAQTSDAWWINRALTTYGPYKKVEPRVWDSVDDIPEGVVVGIHLYRSIPSFFKWVDGVRYMDRGRDEDGVIRWDGGQSMTKYNNDWLASHAPFTEILDAR